MTPRATTKGSPMKTAYASTSYGVDVEEDGGFILTPRTKSARDILHSIGRAHAEEYGLKPAITDSGQMRFRTEDAFALVRTVERCEARILTDTVGDLIRGGGRRVPVPARSSHMIHLRPVE